MALTPPLPTSSPVGPEQSPPVLINAKQAANALAISPRKLWGMTASGQVSCVRLGGAVRYSVTELNRLVSASTEGGAQ